MSNDTQTTAMVHCNIAGADSFIRRTPSGIIRSIRANVRLEKSQGHLYAMKKYDPETRESTPVLAITAQGYYHLNRYIGVSFATPETLYGPAGSPVGNPYLHRTETGEIQFAKARRIGIGRNAIGNLMAIDLTATFDLATYFAQDLWKKWQPWKQGDKPAAWGVLRDSDQAAKPGSEAERLNKIGWKTVRMPGGVSLQVDLSHTDVIKALGEHISRQKFAERLCITVCERNILKRFAVATTLDPNQPTIVPVISWINTDRTWSEYAEMARDVADGKIPNEIKEVVSETADASPDEVTAANAGDVDPENQETAQEPADKEPPTVTNTASDLPALIKGLRAKLETMNPRFVNAVLSTSKIQGLDQLDTLDRDTILNIISEASQY